MLQVELVKLLLCSGATRDVVAADCSVTVLVTRRDLTTVAVVSRLELCDDGYGGLLVQGRDVVDSAPTP